MKLDRLYDRLTPQERLRAFVSAAARKDMEEIDRLNNSCPRKTYTCEDGAYWKAKLDLFVLTMANRIDTADVESILLVCVALIVASEGSEPHETVYESASEIFDKTLALYVAKLEAWARFCAELGLDPEEVQSAFLRGPNPLVDLVMDAVPAERREPEAGEVERLFSGLCASWESRRGPK